MTKIQSVLKRKPIIIGMGNELRGDDAAGILLVRKLQQSGYPSTLIVFDTPENYLQKIASMEGEARLWIDIINWDSTPGDYKIFLPDEIQHFAVSTHNYSPTVLIKYLTPQRAIPDYFLGIQPLNLSLGSKLSEPVQKTIEKLALKIIQYSDIL
ncbi:MAG: hydrogenase maturation protease [bacterium]|nr:MAG: hydrogenase maturation protease [bacterium]